MNEMEFGKKSYLRREVYDGHREDRLVQRLVRVPDFEHTLWDFEVLIWEKLSDGYWGPVVTFNRREFQEGLSLRRWAADISDFDASQGRALVLVGEDSEPDTSGCRHAHYSWWDCDIRNKMLVRLVKCHTFPDQPRPSD